MENIYENRLKTVLPMYTVVTTFYAGDICF